MVLITYITSCAADVVSTVPSQNKTTSLNQCDKDVCYCSLKYTMSFFPSQQQNNLLVNELLNHCSSAQHKMLLFEQFPQWERYIWVNSVAISSDTVI